MIVVSDASPLIALAQADTLSTLKALFGRLLIPESIISSCAGVIDALREHRIYLPGVPPAASATH